MLPEDKYLLTIREAASYFCIGENKLRKMAAQRPNWLLMDGTHMLIKRKLFEKYIDSINAV